MKRFVICFDGTWQKLQQKKPTNIALIARSVAHTTKGPDGEPIPQIVIYTQGVGANTNALDKLGFWHGLPGAMNKLFGGVFGDGLEDSIVETYLRLAFNYEADDEIYVFGFSRGAFCARSFAGLIGAAGIVSRVHAEQAWEAFRLYRTRPGARATDVERRDYDNSRRDFRLKYGKGRRNPDGSRLKTDEVPNITYLGIFETVGQRGMPSVLGGLARKFNARFGFHDMLIGANVLAARHAVAIDERRLGFPPTLWEGVDEANKRPHVKPGSKPYQQRWFIGTHGDVGGGEDTKLSAAPLKWVVDGARLAGLRFYARHGEDESPVDQAVREAEKIYDGRISRPKFWDSLSPMNYPIYTRRIWAARSRKEAPPHDFAADALDPTVVMRASATNIRPRYRPAPLKPFKPLLPKLAEAGQADTPPPAADAAPAAPPPAAT